VGDKKKECERIGRKGGSCSGSLQPNYCSTEGKGQLAKEMIAPTFVTCVIWLLLTFNSLGSEFSSEGHFYTL